MNWFYVVFNDTDETEREVLLKAEDIVLAVEQFHYQFAEVPLCNVTHIERTDYIVITD